MFITKLFSILFFADRVSTITVYASSIYFEPTIFYFLFHRQFVEILIDGVLHQRISVERSVSFLFDVTTNGAGVLFKYDIISMKGLVRQRTYLVIADLRGQKFIHEAHRVVSKLAEKFSLSLFLFNL